MNDLKRKAIERDSVTNFARRVLPDFGGDHTHFPAKVFVAMLHEKYPETEWERYTTMQRQQYFDTFILRITKNLEIPLSCRQCSEEMGRALASVMAEPVSLPSRNPELPSIPVVTSGRMNSFPASYAAQPSYLEEVISSERVTIEDDKMQNWTLSLTIRSKADDPESAFKYLLIARVFKENADQQTGSEKIKLIFPGATRDLNIRWSGKEFEQDIDYGFSKFGEETELGEISHSLNEYLNQLNALVNFGEIIHPESHAS